VINRVRDYIGFAVGFAGFGYVVLWLTGASDRLLLSSTLHAAGAAAAIFTSVSLLLHAVGRRRRDAGAGGAVSGLLARTPVAILRAAAARKPRAPLPRVKPRKHFGLRGKPD